MKPNDEINGGRALVDETRDPKLGSYSLDAEQKTLFHHGRSIHIPPKTFELLLYLARNRNRIIEKHEILKDVWDGAFVEESNLSVHISSLRKILASEKDPAIRIETFPKIGYRLVVGEQDEGIIRDETGVAENEFPSIPRIVSEQIPLIPPRPDNQRVVSSAIKRKWLYGFVCLAIGALVILMLIPGWNGQRGVAMGEGSNVSNRKSEFTWNRQECLRDSAATTLEVGGCDDAVRSFSLKSNPNGNWSYGYSPIYDVSQFFLFEKANHNNHFASPEVPVDFWTRPGEWHPLVLKNTSNVVIVIQGAVVVPPSMFEMHPGPNGERSVVRWVAPADGRYHIQGQFRGINGSGYTTTDVLVIENGSTVRFSANIAGFNFEHPFDLTSKFAAGSTMDFSVGYGVGGNYEGDSTGFSAIVTTLSLEGVATASGQ